MASDAADRKAEEEAKCDRKKAAVIAVLGGALNPVHRGHSATLLAAATELRRQGFTVRACLFAPAPDGYVRRKLGGSAAASAQHRVAMCALAAEESDLLHAPEKTYGSALECGRRHARDGELIVIVCGADRARRKWLKPRPGGCAVIVIGRTGDTKSVHKAYMEDCAAGSAFDPDTFTVLPFDGPTASSTDVRAKLAAAGSDAAARAAVLQALLDTQHLHPGVARYLTDHPDLWASS